MYVNKRCSQRIDLQLSTSAEERISGLRTLHNIFSNGSVLISVRHHLLAYSNDVLFASGLNEVCF